jgi:hypothetical protein
VAGSGDSVLSPRAPLQAEQNDVPLTLSVASTGRPVQLSTAIFLTDLVPQVIPHGGPLFVVPVLFRHVGACMTFSVPLVPSRRWSGCSARDLGRHVLDGRGTTGPLATEGAGDSKWEIVPPWSRFSDVTRIPSGGAAITSRLV